MFHLDKILCVKAISNSGRKLTDYQLEWMATEHGIPLVFMEKIRDLGCSKIWFELTREKGQAILKVVAIAYGQRMEYTEKKVPAIIKAQIEMIEPLKVPKPSGKSGTSKPQDSEKKQLESTTEKIEPIIEITNFDVYEATIIAIHLNKFKSANELKSVLIDNGLSFILADEIMEMKNSGFTKVFVNKKEKKIIGVCHMNAKKEIQFNDDFIALLKNLKSIAPAKTQSELTVNAILDKIRLYGIESLNRQEKIFLDEQSKK
jgi:hypothetical protein